MAYAAAMILMSKNIVSEINYRVSAVFVKSGCKCQHCPNREAYPSIHDDGTNCSHHPLSHHKSPYPCIRICIAACLLGYFPAIRLVRQKKKKLKKFKSALDCQFSVFIVLMNGYACIGYKKQIQTGGGTHTTK